MMEDLLLLGVLGCTLFFLSVRFLPASVFFKHSFVKKIEKLSRSSCASCPGCRHKN